MASEAEGTVVDVVEPVDQVSVSRFLKNRTGRNEDSDYHPTYKKASLADLPDFIEDRSTVKEREIIDVPMPESRISEEEIERLKQETSHLPFDTVLKILAHYHFNIPITIAAAQQMTIPEYMGQGAQRIFTANIAYERDKNPTKLQTVKEFYLASKLRGQCNTKALVNFYYQQKNKTGSNWRLEMPDDGPMTSEERVELQEKMKAGGIRWCRRDPNGPYKNRNKRYLAARRAHQLRRDQPGCSNDFRDALEDTDTSDAVSVASSCHSQRAMSLEKLLDDPTLVLKMDVIPEEIAMGASEGVLEDPTSSGSGPEAAEAPKTSEILEASKDPTSSDKKAPEDPKILKKTSEYLPTSPLKIPKVDILKSTPTTSEKIQKLFAKDATTPEIVTSPESLSDVTTPDIPAQAPESIITPPESTAFTIPSPESILTSSAHQMLEFTKSEPSSESSVPTTLSTSTSTQEPKLHFTISVNDILDSDSTTTSSGSTSSATSTSTTPTKMTPSGTKIKKIYKKKTLEQLRNGPPKTYPGRDRRPKKIFE